MAKIADRGYSRNLLANPENALGYNDAAEAALAKLDAWAGALTPLSMTSRFSTLTSKTVLLKDPRIIMPGKDWVDSAAQREE